MFPVHNSLRHYIHFQINGIFCNLIGSEQCDLSTNRTILSVVNNCDKRVAGVRFVKTSLISDKNCTKCSHHFIILTLKSFRTKNTRKTIFHNYFCSQTSFPRILLNCSVATKLLNLFLQIRFNLGFVFPHNFFIS